MIDPSTLTLTGIFVAGLATSLHCAGMCGLLTCGLGITGGNSQVASIGIYHACRLAGYLIAGAIMGGIGYWLPGDGEILRASWMPWLLIALLVVIAMGMDRRLASVPGLGKVVHLIRAKTLNLPPLARASVVGLTTPLLPCGPLYAMFAIALASGSSVEGARIMFVFGLGAIPAIWATQITSAWVNRKFNARQFQTWRKVLAGLAAISLLWHFALPVVAQIWTGEAPEEGCQCELPVLPQSD